MSIPEIMQIAHEGPAMLAGIVWLAAYAVLAATVELPE